MHQNGAICARLTQWPSKSLKSFACSTSLQLCRQQVSPSPHQAMEHASPVKNRYPSKREPCESGPEPLNWEKSDDLLVQPESGDQTHRKLKVCLLWCWVDEQYLKIVYIEPSYTTHWYWGYVTCKPLISFLLRHDFTGTIGTALFVQIGSSLTKGGPGECSELIAMMEH